MQFNIEKSFIDTSLNYNSRKNKYIEECNYKWRKMRKIYIKECMDIFYQENMNSELKYTQMTDNCKCLGSNCNILSTSPLYKGYCFYCFFKECPNTHIIHEHKTKEKHVNDFIVDQYQNMDFTYNKTIKGGISGKVPDWFFDCITHSIIVENDEYQHRNYRDEDNRNNEDNNNEDNRNMELFKDLGNRPIVFIRFNPDSYIDKKGNLVKSSFKYHKKEEVLIIQDIHEWINRLQKLKDTIDFNIYNIPIKNITIHNLFYDIANEKQKIKIEDKVLDEKNFNDTKSPREMLLLPLIRHDSCESDNHFYLF
jgi:hypothetical protein